MPGVETSTQRVRLERAAILCAASLIALISARWGAGSWHDASRLATVECLVDHHTLAIDESIYVRVPTTHHTLAPYAADFPAPATGTRDRVLIDGRFYSHQPPVPALFMAAEYQLWKWVTGRTARDRPDQFYFFMTLVSSGLGYVIGVGCVHEIAVRMRLPWPHRLLLPVSLAVSTIALVYVRNVNNHLLLLGSVSLVSLGLVALAPWTAGEKQPNGWLITLGTFTGFGYAIDPAIGVVLVPFTTLWVVHRFRTLCPVRLFVVSAVPWVLLHHFVNYSVGGTIRPYGAVPEYLNWPGSAFDEQTMTGVYHHGSLLECVTYALGLLFGSRGFLIHNPPLLLGILGVLLLLPRRPKEWPELAWAVVTSAGAWLLYALLSNNYAGECFSIRWFIPLLAPGFLVLAIFLKHFPRYAWALALITIWGAFFAVDAWMRGPWKAGVVSRSFDRPSIVLLADEDREIDSP